MMEAKGHRGWGGREEMEKLRSGGDVNRHTHTRTGTGCNITPYPELTALASAGWTINGDKSNHVVSLSCLIRDAVTQSGDKQAAAAGETNTPGGDTLTTTTNQQLGDNDTDRRRKQSDTTSQHSDSQCGVIRFAQVWPQQNNCELFCWSHA